MCCVFLSKVLLNQLIKEVAQGKKAVESQSNKWCQQKRTYQYLCSKIVILLWCDSLQSFKAIAFMVHRVLILNILRHLFKNKEICTLDRLCVLMIKMLWHIFWNEILRSTFSYIDTTNAGQGVLYVNFCCCFFNIVQCSVLMLWIILICNF